MSLDVALQSVAFYVLSCSTCAKISHRRKAKLQAKRERAEKHELETEQPGLYRHPSPFSTNPYWTEEIMMGPGPPNKKGGDRSDSKNTSQRALNTAGQGSSHASSSGMSTTDVGSSPTAVTEGSRISGEGWNRKRYQREDEVLWGHDTLGPGQRIMDAIAKAGSTAGRLIESRLSRGSGSAEEENPGTYYLARNPPVNDLHPPVVSTQPASRDETRWMLQPPPPAKVMEGKERVNRNRAGSNGSSRKGGDVTPLSRQMTGRLVDAKLQRGETMPSREDLKKPSPTHSKGQRHRRSRSQSLDSSTSSEGGIRRSRKPPPITVSPSSKNSRDKAVHIPIPSKPTEMNERRTRPFLATIASSRIEVPTLQTDLNPPLQELNPASSAVNSRAPSPSNPLSRLSPSVNAMPASIPSVGSKLSGTSTSRFKSPSLGAGENEDPKTSEA